MLRAHATPAPERRGGLERLDTFFADKAPTLRSWLYDKLGERIEEKVYTGHGTFTTRRGWQIGRHYRWFDKEAS